MEPNISSSKDTNNNNKSLVSQLKAYLWSLDFVEVLICLAGVLIPYYLIKTKLSTTQRPIPYQKLASSGDVVLNLTLNQPMADETFNGSWCPELHVTVTPIVSLSPLFFPLSFHITSYRSRFISRYCIGIFFTTTFLESIEISTRRKTCYPLCLYCHCGYYTHND